MYKTVRNGCYLLVKRAFHASPLFVIKGYTKLYSLYCKFRSRRVPIRHFTGQIHNREEAVHLVYVGWDQRIMDYWLLTFFSHFKPTAPVEKIPVSRIEAYLTEPKTLQGLAIVELNTRQIEVQCEKLNGYIIPRWLKMYLDVEASIQLIERYNSIPRKIRKFAMTVEQGNGAEDFLFFYDRMYKPYVVNRHKCSAVIEDRKQMLEDFLKSTSTLYFVLVQGTRSACLYVQYFQGVPYLHGVGVLDGSDEIMRTGSLAAAYYFALLDFRQKNITRVNIGGTSPLISDGLTWFKMTLGGRVSEMEKQKSLRLKLVLLGHDFGVEKLLASHPFIYIQENALKVVFYKDGDSIETDELFQKRYERAQRLEAGEPMIIRF